MIGVLILSRCTNHEASVAETWLALYSRRSTRLYSFQTRLMYDEDQRVPNKQSRITASGGVSIKHYACTEDAMLHTDDVRLTT